LKKIPNILTILRLFMVPLFWLMYFKNPVYGGIVFMVACITDIIDGFLARKFEAITKFGMLADPLADKMMQISAVICLFISDILPQWIVTIIIMKELIMIISASFLLKKNVVIPSHKVGKASTILLSVMVVYFMIFGKAGGSINIVISAILGVVAFFVLISYLIIMIKSLCKKGNLIV